MPIIAKHNKTASYFRSAVAEFFRDLLRCPAGMTANKTDGYGMNGLTSLDVYYILHIVATMLQTLEVTLL